MGKRYCFYGWENADISPSDKRFEGIKNPRELYDILSDIWCRETCAPRLRGEWTKDNMTLGQCSVTAFLAQDIFGGKVRGILRPGGNYHCYNDVNGNVFDLTSEQFGDEVLEYGDDPEQEREIHFAREEKFRRYKYLKKRLIENMKYVYGSYSNKQFLAEQAVGLLRFGKKFPDEDGKAFWLDWDGEPWKDRDRETWITARMAHVYAVGDVLLSCGYSDEVPDRRTDHTECPEAGRDMRDEGISQAKFSQGRQDGSPAQTKNGQSRQDGLDGHSDSGRGSQYESFVTTDSVRNIADRSCGHSGAGYDTADLSALYSDSEHNIRHKINVNTDIDHNKCRELSEKAVNGLLTGLHDAVNEGWYAAVSSGGEKKGPKQCYAHAFVILAAVSGMLADIPMSRKLFHEADSIYDRYFWDEETGLAADSWDTGFTHKDSYRGLNSNMHSVEALLAAADATGDEKYRIRAGRIIDHVLKWASENDHRLPEHFTEDWKPDLSFNAGKKDDQFRPYGATPGHGMEWARLIVQWALSESKSKYKNKNNTAETTAAEDRYTKEDSMAAGTDKNSDISAYIDEAEKLYMRAFTDGWNADGAPGFVYTTGWDGKPVVHDRMHWTLAEAINTSSVLYRVTENEIYADHYRKYMKYLDECVIDHEKGSWYHQLDRGNHVSDTVWPGKPDIYHAFQAMLIPYLPPDMSIAAAVKKSKSVRFTNKCSGRSDMPIAAAVKK